MMIKIIKRCSLFTFFFAHNYLAVDLKCANQLIMCLEIITQEYKRNFTYNDFRKGFRQRFKHVIAVLNKIKLVSVFGHQWCTLVLHDINQAW